MLSLLIPLLCAMIYPLATLFLRRSLDGGADLWGSLAVNFWVMALVFLAVAPLDSTPVPWNLWWQPALVGVLSFAGQSFGFKAISSGDLTVATPAMGSKVLLVALLTVALLGLEVPVLWWVAAGLSFAAVLLLQGGPSGGRRNVWMTLTWSVAAAASFALGDVLIQRWAPGWGVFHFVPAFAVVTAFLSVGLLPFARKPIFSFPRNAWVWLLPGTLLMALQSLGLTVAIGLYGKAALANIVFSSRGLWNFLLIFFLGAWFGNREREAGGKVMVLRLLGAALMFAAVVLASMA
jgi:drug/metabolite transporter (DMT)-like permease